MAPRMDALRGVPGAGRVLEEALCRCRSARPPADRPPARGGHERRRQRRVGARGQGVDRATSRRRPPLRRDAQHARHGGLCGDARRSARWPLACARDSGSWSTRQRAGVDHGVLQQPAADAARHRSCGHAAGLHVGSEARASRLVRASGRPLRAARRRAGDRRPMPKGGLVPEPLFLPGRTPAAASMGPARPSLRCWSCRRARRRTSAYG